MIEVIIPRINPGPKQATSVQTDSACWRTLPSAPDYEVSDHGQARRVTPGRGTRAGRTLKLTPAGNGRLVFNIRIDGRTRQLKIHRAVMEAFVGPCPPGKEVAHGDGHPTNNRLDNLRYATPRQNNADKKLHGTQPCGRQVPGARLSVHQVRWARSKYPRLSIAAIATVLRVAPSTVASLIQHRTWKHA